MGRKMKQSMKTLKSKLRNATPTQGAAGTRDEFADSSKGRRAAEPAAKNPFEDRYDEEEDKDEEEFDGEAEEQLDEDAGSAPDDALGVYLRQMGAIPLLNRKQELDLAQKLERHRSRFRKA